MWRKLFITAMTVYVVSVTCGIQVHAQNMLHLQAGLFCRLDDLLKEQPDLQAAAVTLVPENMVLWLDGKPLEPYQLVSAKDIERVFLFTAEEGEMGVVVCGEKTRPKSGYRIRSINPVFSTEKGTE